MSEQTKSPPKLPPTSQKQRDQAEEQQAADEEQAGGVDDVREAITNARAWLGQAEQALDGLE